MYFNPLPPHGGRLYHLHPLYANSLFQSTPSAWRETPRRWVGEREFEFQSTPSAWRETPSERGTSVKPVISIHSLRMEGDGRKHLSRQSTVSFQSTPSAWRETEWKRLSYNIDMHFNPLPPHGGRLGTQTEKNRSEVFQSTPSAWRETNLSTEQLDRCDISIHSLRMEGDIILPSDHPLSSHFNPLPPHGGRLTTGTLTRWRCSFQSTPSAWRETRYDSAVYKRELISIHSLRMEGDEEALARTADCNISIHSLRMEGDNVERKGENPFDLFQSTPSAWRETDCIRPEKNK